MRNFLLSTGNDSGDDGDDVAYQLNDSAAKVILRVLFENGKGHENHHQHDGTEIQFRLTGF